MILGIYQFCSAKPFQQYIVFLVDKEGKAKHRPVRTGSILFERGQTAQTFTMAAGLSSVFPFILLCLFCFGFFTLEMRSCCREPRMR